MTRIKIFAYGTMVLVLIGIILMALFGDSVEPVYYIPHDHYDEQQRKEAIERIWERDEYRPEFHSHTDSVQETSSLKYLENKH